ncbi:hypothetical protein [Anatilimnocola floriformis]|uniref:hypothetical protein n=1 Tax=Anatilimnocola floriformis TaxID=2948575 RepID=UPI0020C202E6|nr:hypothetical protein [Anatilimnocola floriformis]
MNELGKAFEAKWTGTIVNWLWVRLPRMLDLINQLSQHAAQSVTLRDHRHLPAALTLIASAAVEIVPGKRSENRAPELSLAEFGELFLKIQSNARPDPAVKLSEPLDVGFLWRQRNVIADFDG